MHVVDEDELRIYLSDAVAQLLIKRKTIKINIQKHFKDYFQLVLSGNHILHREFTFVIATAYNCHCFVHLLRKSMQNVGNHYDKMSVNDLHALFQLLCPDFPECVLEILAKLLGHDDTASCVIKFSELLPYIHAYLPLYEFFHAAVQNANPTTESDTFTVEDYVRITENVSYRLPKQTDVEEILRAGTVNSRVNFCKKLLKTIQKPV